MSTGFDPLKEWLGIPADEQPPHCYRLLGLHIFEDRIQVIESAADRQAAYVQTLLAGPHAAVAQEVLNQIATARAWLVTAENKAQYDAWLKEQLGWGAPPPQPEPASPPEPAEPEVAPDVSQALDGADLYVPSHRRAQKGRKRSSLGVMVSLVAAIVAVVAIGLAAFYAQSLFSDTGTLVVQWPEEERRDGVLEIDGKRVDMAPGAEIACRVPMGAHSVKCIRPGYEPFEVTMPITTGKVTTLRPAWRQPGQQADVATTEPSGDKDRPAAKDSAPKPAKQEKADDFSFDMNDKK